jgi:hypothetical protein
MKLMWHILPIHGLLLAHNLILLASQLKGHEIDVVYFGYSWVVIGSQPYFVGISIQRPQDWCGVFACWVVIGQQP